MTVLKPDWQQERDDRPAASLAVALGRACSVLSTCMGRDSALATRIAALSARLREDRLQLAVLGQFKRGKSTLINALLGAPLLPIAVVPLTAVPVFIAWRTDPLVSIRFKGDRPDDQFASRDPQELGAFLFRFVAEEANPENRLGVARVDLFYPAPILADGTVLIDTPGVGSTLRHNTEAARQVLPECDAAIFVVSADPPITETELDYLRQFHAKMARVFFVLNKVDYLRPAERESMVGFLRKVLTDSGTLQADAPIFCVSARDGLEAKSLGDAAQLESSGIAAVETHLVRHLASEKHRLLESAVRNKATSILSEALTEIALRLQAINMPIDELTSKSREFEDALIAIEEQRRVTGDLLRGDQRRLKETIEARIDALRREASAKLSGVVDDHIGRVPAWEEPVRRALATAIEETFDAARRRLVGEISDSTGMALSAHQGRIDGLVDRVRRTAADIFEVPFAQSAENAPFHLGQDPYWVTEDRNLTLIPDWSRLLDPLLPRWILVARMRARAIRQVNELVVRNAENLRWAILRGMEETFRRASPHFEEQLDAAVGTTREVIADSLARRREGAAEIEQELARLNDASRSLGAVRQELVDAA